MEVFTYSWHVRDNKQETRIVGYGVSRDGETVQFTFSFSPRCYVGLPETVEWTEEKLKSLKMCLKNKLLTEHFMFVKLPVLFGGGVDDDGNFKTYPFLYCAFKNRASMMMSQKLLENVYLPFLGSLATFKFHETQTNSIVQAVTSRDIGFSGWISLPKHAVDGVGTRTFGCVEASLKYSEIVSIQNSDVASLRILSFDLETYSEDWLKFPNADVVDDCIFQISCIFSDTSNQFMEKILLCQLCCTAIPGVEIRLFDNEYMLIKGFAALVREKSPHIIIGYNIMKFDLPYLIKRATLRRCRNDFDLLGFPNKVPGKVVEKKWSSSAYKDQEYIYLDIEGRIYVDLNPFVEKNFKLENYKLSTVAKHFLRDDKVDLDIKTMFGAFSCALAENPDAPNQMARVGEYCIHDSVLVLNLFHRLQVWLSLVEMSNVVHCPISDILIRGQQIRVYNSIVKWCFKKMVIVKPPEDDREQKYVGAYVFDPVPGMYENVVPFDFASLYPSTIIAYNIDYSTFVSPNDHIDDSECHVFEWEDHVGCQHDPKMQQMAACTDKRERADLKKKMSKNEICERRRFRFLKKPEGVLPSIIRKCLDARKETRKQLALLSPTDVQWTVLNQRQLAYKVSANSMYGFTGIGSKGMLSFLPLAMCITFRGRENVKKAAEEMTRRYGAVIVYGDTDSNYVVFPKKDTVEKVWEQSVTAAAEVSSIFPEPMELEFEETIYAQFLILAKKKYVFQKMNRSGILDDKIGKIGVVLTRRDNCKFIRDTYEYLVRMVFANAQRPKHCNFDCVCRECIVYNVVCKIHCLHQRQVELCDLTMTKGCRDAGSCDTPENGHMGVYKIKQLPEDCAAKRKKLGCKTEKDFYLSQLPAVAQLKKRMERRGLAVTEGSRVEFVIVNYGGAKQGDNIEDVDYFREFSSVLTLDYMYYLNLLINPLDQILETCFAVRDVTKKIVCLKIAKQRLCKSIKDLFSPKWPFEKLKVHQSGCRVGTVKIKTWDIKHVR